MTLLDPVPQDLRRPPPHSPTPMETPGLGCTKMGHTLPRLGLILHPVTCRDPPPSWIPVDTPCLSWTWSPPPTGPGDPLLQVGTPTLAGHDGAL